MAKPAPAKRRGFTTRMFYGRVSVRHYDRDHIVRIADIINRALIDAGEPTPIQDSMRVDWIYYEDGTETVDLMWDGKQWGEAT